jgi:transposase
VRCAAAVSPTRFRRSATSGRTGARRGSAGGRPPAFDRDRYKQRNVVERCFNRLKQFRALATRYAKRAAYYRATLLLVSTVLWLRD